VNRHCAFQAEALIKTGKPHIQDELVKILTIAKVLPQDCVIVDAGANIGLVSIPIAHSVTNKGGVVHAFEPQRMMAYALSGSTALNDLNNLHIYQQGLGAAVGSIPGNRVDYGEPQDFGMYSLVETNDAQPENIVITTIDTLDLPRLDFLKIDVEGMEVEVLTGGKNTIAQHLPWCWIEYWKVDIEEIKAQFDGLNYEFYLMDQLNMLCVQSEILNHSGLKIDAKKI